MKNAIREQHCHCQLAPRPFVSCAGTIQHNTTPTTSTPAEAGETIRGSLRDPTRCLAPFVVVVVDFAEGLDAFHLVILIIL